MKIYYDDELITLNITSIGPVRQINLDCPGLKFLDKLPLLLK